MSLLWCRDTTDEDRINAYLNKELRKYKHEYQRTTKLMLLGPGESGKSTFFKQLRLLHEENSFSEEERIAQKRLIFLNIIGNFISLLEAAETFQLPLQLENEEFAQKLRTDDLDLQNGFGILVQPMKNLWQDPSIKECFLNRRHQFQLSDSAEYFFQSLDRIGAEGFVPTTEDILRIRIKTTGVVSVDLHIEKEKFNIVDVGGQRSERKKWIHFFDNVTAVIFFASLNEYDQKLVEADEWRMVETMELFKEIAHSAWFKRCPIILFLNKYDLFSTKIKKVPLNKFEFFKDYNGTDDPLEAAKYIERQLRRLAPADKQIYVHRTTATNTDNVRKVWHSVRDTVLMGAMTSMGFVDAIEPAPVHRDGKATSSESKKLKLQPVVPSKSESELKKKKAQHKLNARAAARKSTT